ncbi:MAG TPA: 6-phosphofructokinase, partial [Cyclobacteriaceae bacterium]|nr:6-phosphofructokinase [Cyclobacteriaceae bacterium]
SSYFDIKVTVLGHLLRGGAPTYFDRVLASKMGVAAVEGLLRGENDAMVGIRNNEIVFNSFDFIMSRHHEIDQESMRIAKILSI